MLSASPKVRGVSELLDFDAFEDRFWYECWCGGALISIVGWRTFLEFHQSKVEVRESLDWIE